MNRTRLAFAAAAAVFALGLLVTVRSLKSTPMKIMRTRRKVGDLQELRELAGRHQSVVASLHMFDRLRAHSPRTLTEIGSDRPAVRRLGVKPAAGGWNVLTVTATFEDIPLARLSEFLHEATAAGNSPPWRLTECSITALDQGRGRAVLTLEALEKPEAEL